VGAVLAEADGAPDVRAAVAPSVTTRAMAALVARARRVLREVRAERVDPRERGTAGLLRPVSVSEDNEAVTDEVTHPVGVDETSMSHEPHPRAICDRQPRC